MKMKVLEVCFHCHKRLVPAPGELRMRRQAAGLTMTALAEMLGRSPALVILLEEGKRKPSAEVALRIHKARSKLDALARKRVVEINRLMASPH